MHSPLTEITPENVASLEKVWEYHTGDVRVEEDPEETTYKVTPMLVDGLLYLCTAHQIAIALDPLTGEEVWRHDPQVGVNKQRQHQTCRGLSYVAVEGAAADSSCASRVLLPTADARLIALDAKTGTVCAGFGNNGTVNLALNMPHYYPGSYYSTSPPVVANGLIVVGGAVNDNVSTTEPSGVIRAYSSGTSTAATLRKPNRSPKARNMSAIRPTPGRSCRSIRTSTWSMRRWATPRPTSLAATARRRPSASLRRSSRSISEPARCAGFSRPCTTICGTWIRPRSRSSSI
jgi:quinoprotein glucose dehydrogenase